MSNRTAQMLTRFAESGDPTEVEDLAVDFTPGYHGAQFDDLS